MTIASKKPQILIADDRPSSRELLRLVLERAGYDVTEAEDGERALTQAETDFYRGHMRMLLGFLDDEQ